MIAVSKRVTTSVTPATFVSFPTDLGWMALQLSGDRLLRLTFGHKSGGAALKALGEGNVSRNVDSQQQKVIDRLVAFAAGESDELLKIRVEYGVTTSFQKLVLDACRAIPAGETLSYGQLAQLVGAPGAARAVGNVMRTNKIPLVVPCHRVVGSGGNLGGYSAPEGLGMKRRLLEREGVVVRG